MELYIEKEFLDNFYLDYHESVATRAQHIMASILTEYGEIDWFIDIPIETTEDFENLKIANPFFALRAIYSPPVPVKDLKAHFFDKSKCRQTMMFTGKEKEWFGEALNRGAICFSFDDYQEKITSLITQCHVKIDLSEDFSGWSSFSFFNNIPFNNILINDNYILTDKSNHPMEMNLIPLLHQVLMKKKDRVNINIFTKDLNAISDSEVHILEAAKKRHKKLNRELANYSKKITIINNDLQKDKFDLHDRVLISNFLSVDSGKGFNLLPHKKSNSQIVVDSIFDKYTYKRIKNHLKIYQQYMKKFETLETSKFVMFPS